MKIGVICLKDDIPFIQYYYKNDIEIISKNKYFDSDDYFTEDDERILKSCDVIVGGNNSEELDYLVKFNKPIISVGSTSGIVYNIPIYNVKYSDRFMIDVIFDKIFSIYIDMFENNIDLIYDNLLLVIDKNTIYGQRLKDLFLTRICKHLVSKRTDGIKSVKIDESELNEYILEVDENNVIDKMQIQKRKIILFSAYKQVPIIFYQRNDNNEEIDNNEENNIENGIIICFDSGFTRDINVQYYENDNNLYRIYNTSYDSFESYERFVDTNKVYENYESVHKYNFESILERIGSISNISDIANALNMTQINRSNNFYKFDLKFLLSVFDRNCYGITDFHSFDLLAYSTIKISGDVHNVEIPKFLYKTKDFQTYDYCVFIGPYKSYVVINNVEDNEILLPFYGKLLTFQK